MNKNTQTLEDLVETSYNLWGRPSEAEMPEVRRRIEILKKRETAISDCLIVVMVGGTKVGKTTLINALAGKNIGEASAIACFTKRPAIFVHRSREAIARSRLTGILTKDDRVEIHEEPCLERIILVDTPDLDGIETANRQVFMDILERADLALCVVTTQKYDSMALYDILGNKMGFRRTIFLFNRIDEGIPLSEKIRKDLMEKISNLNLKPPEGESLPIFAISAQNALNSKMGDFSGPTGDFFILEDYLKKRLDQALVQRISEENLLALAQETRRFVADAAAVESAIKFSQEIQIECLELEKSAKQKISVTLDETLEECFSELGKLRGAAAAEGMGGPFGAYLRATLAIWALLVRLKSFIPRFSTDLGDSVTLRLISLIEPIFLESQTRIHRNLVEKADKMGIEPRPLLSQLKSSGWDSKSIHSSLSAKVREFILEPKTGPWESLIMNILPITIILFLFRYFIISLITAHDPSAGMFLGSGLLLWLVCHLQTTFWLGRKAGSLGPLKISSTEIFSNEFRKTIAEPINFWVQKVLQISN